MRYLSFIAFLGVWIVLSAHHPIVGAQTGGKEVFEETKTPSQDVGDSGQDVGDSGQDVGDSGQDVGDSEPNEQKVAEDTSSSGSGSLELEKPQPAKSQPVQFQPKALSPELQSEKDSSKLDRLSQRTEHEAQNDKESIQRIFNKERTEGSSDNDRAEKKSVKNKSPQRENLQNKKREQSDRATLTFPDDVQSNEKRRFLCEETFGEGFSVSDGQRSQNRKNQNELQEMPQLSKQDPGSRDNDNFIQYFPIPFFAEGDASEGSASSGNASGNGASGEGALAEWIPQIPDARGRGFWVLFFVLLIWGVSLFVGKLRLRLPTKGFIPWMLAVIHVLLRFLILTGILFWLVSLLPSWLGPILKLVLVAIAIALGWSARDILPDIISGFILLIERRVRRGFWVSGEGFEGTVRRVGLRSTQLRDSKGHLVIVPNSQLLKGPMLSDTAVGAEREVTMLMQSEKPASRIRKALHDAILLSPWVPPNAKPMVLRDPKNPSLWHIRTRLLEAKYAVRFEGELMERAEELLIYKPPISKSEVYEKDAGNSSNSPKTTIAAESVTSEKNNGKKPSRSSNSDAK